MSEEVTRHFVTLDGRWGPRQVHYRRAGQGPAVVLLHQSPQSSRELVPLMRRWSPHFTLIAPDTPGYGQSDPLGPPEVGIEQFADALGEFVDAIGLRRFGVYGYHTGASIGLWLAARHPGRVTALAANGLAQFTAAERDLIRGKYLPPVVPAWDGSHLAWMWGRVREQAIFFPWHERSAATRMTLDVPPPEWLHAALMEFLRAGYHYAVAYSAAFASRPETVLPTLQVPLRVTAADGDPLQAHIGRLRDLPAGVEASPAPGREQALERCLEHLLARRGDAAPAPVATRPVPGRLWNRMVRLPDGQARVRLQLAGAGMPVTLLHDAGRSADTAARLATALAGSRPLLIADLPGHGESDAGAGAAPGVAACADAVLAILNELGLDAGVLAGQGAGAYVALEAGRRSGGHAAPLALLDLPFLGDSACAAYREHGLPAIEPQWHGGHLLEAWHLLRDGRLFFPWFERRNACARRIEPDLDERRLQEELLDLLRAPQAWRSLCADALDYPAAAALAAHRGPVALGASADSAWLAATREAAASRAGCEALTLPRAEAAWLPSLLAALGAPG